ncbi:MAG: retron system putative HNH endonuclease [Snowella sp.]|nr:retron system putative HNH endonuclease [Snowella sp.]
MKKVLKSPKQPDELDLYKKRFSHQSKKWKDVKKSRETYDAIWNTLLSDQKGLCAYCEMALSSTNRSVEHFIPRSYKNLTQEKNYELDWNNLLAVCLTPGGLMEVDSAQAKLFKNSPCCGKKKDDFVPDERFLNPLHLPTARLFRFSSEDGEIFPDETACNQVGIPIENVDYTINEILALNVPRLKDQRLAVITQLDEDINEFDDGSVDLVNIYRKIAEIYFGDGTQNWPRFFTTMRWMLKEGAEQYLQSIDYRG